MRKGTWLLILCMLAMLTPVSLAGAAESKAFAVEVTVPGDYEGELNGRVLFMFDHELPEAGDELFYSLGATGIPVFGKTVYGLKAGDTVTLAADDPDVFGWPMQLGEAPSGEYAVQAFFIVYTEFARKDAPSIWGMADHGGGGDFTSNPYNLYSDAKLAMLGEGTIALELTNEIPLGYELADGQVTQQGNYEDTDLVKYVKIKSELLTDFWGTDMYIGANVLLPKDYDPAKTYPVLYYQGHWPGGNAPMNYGRTGRDTYEAFNAYWESGEAPEMIIVTFRDANMFYDTSYSVNSANLGPWGDAIVEELIPYIEERFGAVGEPWARALAGGSTGGWESLAMQVFYPDFFGGAWPMCPDGVDFHAYQIVNLYDDENAYYLDNGWYRVERPSCRDISGNVMYTVKDENYYEIAIGGLEAVGLGQWAVWESVYGPMGENGYPERVWEPLTGVINKDVVEHWKAYDLSYILQNNWAELGPKLVGKIHLRGGDMDNYYLNLAQYILGDWLETTEAPYYDGYSVTFPRKGHTGNITNQELLEEVAAHMIQYGPEDAAGILGKH